MRIVAAVFVTLLVACGSSPPASSPPTSTPPPTGAPPPTRAVPAAGLEGHLDEGLFVPSRYTGDPRACTADADCTCNTAPIATLPCCQDATTLTCYRQDYWEALSTARFTACTGVTCPIPPPPMLPLECRLTGRCVAGRCGDACASAPPSDVPPPS
jgi:hypothetical protein